MTGTVKQIKELSSRLSDIDPQVRRDAARLLGERQEKDAIPALVYSLGDKNQGCQETAMEALSKIRGPKAVEQLLPLLSHSNARIRNAAIEVLEEIGEDAPRLIAQLLQEDSSALKIHAANILGVLNVPSVLDALVDLLDDKNPNVRCSAVKAIAQIGNKKWGKTLYPLLNDPEDWVRFSTIEALGRLQDKDSFRQLVEKLDDVSEDIVCAAVGALGVMGCVESVPRIIKLFNQSSHAMRNQIVHHLVCIAEKQDQKNFYATFSLKRCEGYFIEALDSDQKEIQVSALQGLEFIGTKNAVQPILTLLKTLKPEEDINRIEQIEKTLTSIGESKEIIHYIKSLPTPFDVNEETSIIIMIQVLTHLRAREAVPVILPLAHGTPESIRRVLTRAIGAIEDAAGLNTLLTLLQDKNGHVRRDAAQALGQIHDDRAITPLFDALDREDYQDVQEVILETLIAIGGETVKDKFRVCIFYPEARMKELAARAIGQLNDHEACEHLIANLGDENPYIRQAIVEALGMVDCEKFVEPILHCLTDEYEKVRLAAIDALSNIRSSRAAQGLISSLYDTSSWVAHRAAEALASTGEHDAVEPMMELLRATTDDLMKITLIRALQKLGDPRSATVFQLLQNDPNPEIRELLVRVESP